MHAWSRFGASSAVYPPCLAAGKTLLPILQVHRIVPSAIACSLICRILKRNLCETTSWLCTSYSMKSWILGIPSLQRQPFWASRFLALYVPISWEWYHEQAQLASLDHEMEAFLKNTANSNSCGNEMRQWARHRSLHACPVWCFIWGMGCGHEGIVFPCLRFCRYIKTDAHKMEVAVKPPMAVTNAVSWRTEGIRHKKNEVSWDSFRLQLHSW